MTDPVLITKKGRVALLTLNRPEALNALSTDLLDSIVSALSCLENDANVAAVVITGEGRAFAAGADIKEMQNRRFSEMYLSDYFAGWDRVAEFRKPLIAAVNGFALGGGCELALMCDIIIASDQAKFGLPEIKLGVTPGIGGTQRLTRAVGKSRAMDLILTGRMIDAAEAERIGLVSRLIPAERLVDERLSVGELIGAYSSVALIAAKEMVSRSLELGTREGVKLERRLFHALFGTEDKKEGMAAFIQKRSPVFRDC